MTRSAEVRSQPSGITMYGAVTDLKEMAAFPAAVHISTSWSQPSAYSLQRTSSTPHAP